MRSPSVSPAPIIVRRVSLAFEIERGLARHRERHDFDPGRRAVGSVGSNGVPSLDRLATHVLRVQHVEDAVVVEHLQHRRGRRR